MTKSFRLTIYLTVIFVNLILCGGLSSQVQAQGYSLQVVSYLTAADAQAEVNRLKAKKLDAYWVKAEIPGMGTRYRVRVGRYSDEHSAMLGAASACTARAISQYMLAQGDSVPTGVPAKTCASALAYVSREKNPVAPMVKPVEVASKSAPLAKPKEIITKTPPPPPVMPPTRPAIAANPKPTPPAVTTTQAVTKPMPVPNQKALLSREAQVMNAPSNERIVVKGGRNYDRLDLVKIDSTKKPKMQNSLMPKGTTVTTPAVAEAPKPVKVTAPATVPFTRAENPKDIVTNAYQYAATKSAKLMAAVPAKANTKGETAITNPKWKVSQNGGAAERNLHSVYFVDAWTGWAAGEGGTIYQTSDGGKQWSEIRSAAIAGKVVDVNKIYFINENKGWMLADTRTSKSDDPQTVLLSTVDGGQIWQNISLPNVTSFYFVDEKKGWAVGKNSTLMKSVDGGIRWTPVQNLSRVLGLPVESASSSFGFSDIFFMNAEVGWAVGNFYGKTTTNIGGLFMTMDGGETWQRVPLAIKYKTQSTRFTKGKLQTVRFSDVSHGLITGEVEEGNEKYFFTLKTSDGGETWEQTRVPTNAAHKTQFVDGARGWSAAASVRAEVKNQPVYDTVMMHTNNGGKSWETDFVTHGQQIRSVFFISPSRGWAVGDRGMILRYDSE